MKTTEEIITDLAKELSNSEIINGIGISSNPTLIEKEGGDIDLFVYSTTVVPKEYKIKVYNNCLLSDSLELEKYDSIDWGKIDFLKINGIEACVMYFTIDNVNNNIKEICDGERSTNESGYYPTGRLALFMNIFPLYEKNNFFNNIKDSLSEYPVSLKMKIINNCLWALNEEENLDRGKDRKDILFFHMAVESTIDHIIQLLFALNNVYMPSRKRNEQFINNFKLKPLNIYNRLIDIIKLSSSKETIDNAYENITMLKNEVIMLAKQEIA